MTDTNKERAEFEAWLGPAWSRDTFADDDGDTLYVEDWVQGAWMMFCHNRASLAAKAPAAPQGDGDMLRAHAEGRVTHINNGLCPDIIEGHDTRDPECPVCQALLENHAALPAPPQGAAKVE